LTPYLISKAIDCPNDSGKSVRAMFIARSAQRTKRGIDKNELFSSHPRRREHVALFRWSIGGRPVLRAVRRGGRLGLLAAVEVVPHLVPVAARRGLRIFGRAGLEEIGVLDSVE